MNADESLYGEDRDVPEEVLSLSGERSYTIEQLLYSVPQIDVIRECSVLHFDDHIELEEVKRYSLDFSKRRRENLFSPAKLSHLFGNRAANVFELLKKAGYAESVNGQIRFKTKMIVSDFEDFSLGKPREFEKVVFRGIYKLLQKHIDKRKDESGNWIDNETYSLYDKKSKTVPRISASSRNYIFRIGNRFYYTDFFFIPSQELLELIQLRMTLIYQEQMENFFQIISTFSLDRESWVSEKDRAGKFKEILKSLFSEVWTLFDLESFTLQINSKDGEYDFACGTYNCSFSVSGEDSWEYGEEQEELPPVQDLSREFLARNVHLVYSQFTGDTVTMDIYMKSRSVNNIDPRTSVLLHSLLRLLKESIARIMETVIPIVQMEEANRVLKRHLFLEALRTKNSYHGENINLILNQSISIIKWVFKIKQVALYTESKDYLKMLRMFQRFERGAKQNFEILDSPLTTKDKERGNILEVLTLEQIGETVSFYFTIPPLPEKRMGKKKRNGYLEGSAVEESMRSLLIQHGISWPKTGLKVLAELVFPPSAGVATNMIIERLSKETNWLEGVFIPQLADRMIKSFTLFFDLTDALDGNLESGVTSMRGARDRLTGLYNRQAFSQKLSNLFDDKAEFGLMFLDMDTFKIYNDAVSHSFGDKLLIQLSNQLLEFSNRLNHNSLSGRFGGDEFCFAAEGCDFDDFENHACELFKMITQCELSTRFHLLDRPEKDDFDVNMITFLHRMLRPDVGGVRGAGSDYVEEKGLHPRDRLLKLYLYYQREINGNDIESADRVSDDVVVEFFVETISGKVKRNKIFSSIDAELDLIIRLFIELQMKDMVTGDIRSHIIDKLGKNEVYRTIRIRISSGLAHSREDRLRSVSSLFNAADGRSYMAKHNGRNGLFGLQSQRLI